jgi:hypothetical protein
MGICAAGMLVAASPARRSLRVRYGAVPKAVQLQPELRTNIEE